MNHTVQLIVILLRFHIFLLNILDENVSDDDLLRAHITIVEYCKNENSTSLRSCLWSLLVFVIVSLASYFSC